MHMAATCNYISAINKFSPSANPLWRNYIQILIHLLINHFLRGAEIITQSSGKIIPILGENYFPMHIKTFNFLFLFLPDSCIFSRVPNIRPFNHYRNQNLIKRSLYLSSRVLSIWKLRKKSLHVKDSTFQAGIIAPTHDDKILINFVILTQNVRFLFFSVFFVQSLFFLVLISCPLCDSSVRTSFFLSLWANDIKFNLSSSLETFSPLGQMYSRTCLYAY